MIFGWEGVTGRRPFTISRRRILQFFASSAAIVFASNKNILKAASATQNVAVLNEPLLLRIAKDIYPHDGFLEDQPYIDVINKLVKKAKENNETRTLLVEGLSDLNARAKKIHGLDYISISSYEAREGLLRSIEQGNFFQEIRGGLLFGLYNNPALFPKFGYGGSSWEHGGYIDRGFSDIDWLPQDPRKNGGQK